METERKSKLSRWFSETNTLPFVIGLFVGMLVFNTDIIYNAALTVLGGGSWHLARLFIVRN